MSIFKHDKQLKVKMKVPIKCSYCHGKVPEGAKATYAYGLPGFKNVVKCDRWLCTKIQVVMSKVRLLQGGFRAMTEHMRKYG